MYKVIATGQYAVVPKNQANQQTSTLISPGAQTCVVLVINSPQGVAMAHIDTPFYAAETAQTMIRKLKTLQGNDSTSSFSAELIGGSTHPLNGSQAIYEPIYTILSQEHIQYKHDRTSFFYQDHFLFHLSIVLIAAYMLYKKFSEFNGFNYAALIAVGVLAYACDKLIKYMTSHSYDILADINSGKINIIEGNINSFKNTYQSHATQEQRAFLAHRSKIPPRDPSREYDLVLQDISHTL